MNSPYTLINFTHQTFSSEDHFITIASSYDETKRSYDSDYDGDVRIGCQVWWHDLQEWYNVASRLILTFDYFWLHWHPR